MTTRGGGFYSRYHRYSHTKLYVTMAVYDVFSYSVKVRHRSTICSSATVFITLTYLLTVIAPFIVVYRSNGFWLRSDTFKEQPQVLFKYRYILIAETERLDEPIICGTFPNINSKTDRGVCSLVKVREADNNNDGKYDELFFEIYLQLGATKSVYAVKLLLIFDYRLHTMLAFQMESLGFIQFSSCLPGARLDVSADLQLVQKELLKSHGRDFRFNNSVIEPNLTLGEFDLRTIVVEYSQRNVTSILRNIYPLWTSGYATDAPFVVSAVIHYPEETIMYRPKFWQIMKWAWMQYLSVLIIFFYLFRAIKIYVFHNQLVSSLKDVPWKKTV